MTIKEINDGNRIIAKWLGYEYIPSTNPMGIKPGWWYSKMSPSIRRLSDNPDKLISRFYIGRNVKDLHFHDNWERLMPALTKIIFRRYASITINASLIGLSKYPDFLESLRVQTEPCGAVTSNPIELIWQLVVKFIKYETK